MTHAETTDTSPVIPARLRTILYMAVAVGGIILLLVSGLAPIWLEPETAARLVDSTKVVSGALAAIGGFVGYAYRPTK